MPHQNWIQKTNILSVVGLSGVSARESKRARAWGLLFNYLVVIVAIVLLLQWQMEMLNQLEPFTLRTINLSVWCFFLLELLVLLYFVKDRWRFLRQNWLLLVIIIVGIPVITQNVYATMTLRILRPMLAFVILAPALRLLIQFFVDGKLLTTLFAASIIVVLFGVLIAGVDPNIKTAWEGIWYAVVTVSTVGYGDIVPVSPLGRLLGVCLIVMGLGIFVVITANFLALMLRKEAAGLKREEKQVDKILDHLKDLQDTQAELNRTLNSINQKVKKMEKDKDSDRN